MFIKKSTRKYNGKTYITHYLVESFRDKDTKKVKHRNIANLSELPPKSLLALKESLNWNTSNVSKHKIEDLEVIGTKQYGSITIFQKIFDNIFGKIIGKKMYRLCNGLYLQIS
ncbi:hypothetical protein [Candidatus Vampirococcus lugosii]|nr:hypothetical protein [Candidatus Vampirococcus lugosii]